MRRTERLFQIIQILRASRRPVTGQELAKELEVSLRTLYRDMAELTAQRVPVRGEAGTGYVLDQGYDMPPLMLTADELEAAVLGAAWVAQRGDPALARAARDLVSKISDSIPKDLRPILLDAALKPMSFRRLEKDPFDLAELRAAIRNRLKARIDYADVDGRATTRTVWPVLVAYTDDVRLLAAWCELRNDFRHFRTDRIRAFALLDQRIPEPHAALRRKWEKSLKESS